MDFKDTRFVVITRGRVGQLHVLKYMPERIQKMFTIVCHKGEKHDHLKEWEGKVSDVCEYEGNNIAEARKWCIEHFEEKFCFFFDDGCVFAVRGVKPCFGDMLKCGLTKMTTEQFTVERLEQMYLEMFNMVISKIRTDEYGIVGVSYRTGNNRVEEDYKENTRLGGVWAINRDLYYKLGFDKEHAPIVKEDFYLLLRFLTQGYKTCSVYKFCLDKKGGVNMKGGCSIYRTQEVINKCSEDFQKLFPQFVKLRDISYKKSWKGCETGTTYDVTVYWKKAYQYGLMKRNKK